MSDPFRPLGEALDKPHGLRLAALGGVEPRNVRWLLPGLIPLRTLTLVAGVGGLGKSMWLAGVAARLSRGQLDGHGPADTVILSYEDSAAEVLRPRVEAAGGDVQRVHVIVPEHRHDVELVALPRDVEKVEQLVRSVETRLLVIDPIVAGIALELDTHKDQHVRIVLARLAELAEEADCAVALVGHLNKAPSTDAYIRVANSVAFWNAARSVVLVTEDGGSDELRLIAQRKANYARLRPVERHQVEGIVLPDLLDAETGEPIETARMSFVEYADDVDSAELLAPQQTTKTEAAETLLGSLLGDGGWHESAGMKHVMGAAGYSERTTQRVAKSLRVEVDRRGVGPEHTAWWRLPDISLAGVSAEYSRRLSLAPSAVPKSGASECSAQPCDSGTLEIPLAPLAPTLSEGRGPPLPGDEGYPELVLAAAVKAGQLTDGEAAERLAHHKLFVRAANG
jgi:hypothetical protein